MDLGQIFTNQVVARYMVSLFSLEKSSKMLEPCFGDGVFLTALRDNGFSNIIGYEIDANLFDSVNQKSKDFFLYNSDFLSTNIKNDIDGIIMNPPYVRQEKIDELAPLGVTKARLRQNPLFSELPTTANMYMYFIVKAISLLKCGGELVVIFPGSWLNARSGKQFEKIIYSQCTLIEQDFVTGDVFEKNVLTDVIILKLKKGSPEQKPVIKHLSFESGEMLDRKIKASDLKLDFSKNFDSYGVIRRGMTTGYNSMYINPPFKDISSKNYLRKIISSPKEIKGYSTKNAQPDYVFVSDEFESLPKEIKDYIHKFECEIQNQKSPKTLYDRMKSDKNWFSINTVNSSGILFSYFVRNDMKFVYNEQNYLARDNFYIIKQKNIDTLLLFALLNNYYTFYQLEQMGKKYGAGLLKLQRYDLENLTFPDIALFTSDDIEQLKQLSTDLILTGNAETISEITKVISRHSSLEYNLILKNYQSVKSSRLGMRHAD